MSHPKPLTLVWVVSTCTIIFAPAIALTQPIIPDNDGTGTLVTPEGDRFNIHGGQTSGDGTNLFHSFQEFGLDAGQTANFQSSPEIQNILGRITGGNASLIDGLIEVTGSNANLFLMNPAGIVFGDNAQLNVPASFTATTATGIGLDGGWFHTFGSNDYTALVGTPNAFDFATIAPAGIINRGNLSVADGANLSLFGGTVVSAGTLQADGGEISVAAVPGENLLRLSAEGNILSLEVSPATSSFSLLNARSLPELLTLGESIADADTLVVNPDGTVALTGSGLRVEDGDVVVVGGENSEPNLQAGSAILAADRNLTLTETQLSTTGDLTLLAGDTLQVRDSIANRVLTEAGGDLSLRGTRGIDILALNHPQTPFVSGGDLSLASGGFISGDAHYSTGGNFSILTLDGEPGEFFSLIDPIIFANGDVTFGDYTGPSLVIEATGEITTGNITINGIDPNIADEPVLILRAGRTPTPITLGVGGTTTEAGTVFSAASTAATSPGIEAGNILIDAGGIGGLTFLEAPGNIAAGSIESNGGTIFLNSIAGSISTTGLLDSTAATGDSGLIALQADGDITASGLDASSDDANPGDVTLYSVTGDIDVDAIDASSVDGEGGEVLLFSQEGAIAAGDIDTSSDNSIGGNVSFQGLENVTTASIDASGISGGKIDLRSTNGGIASRGILTSGGENITLQAASDVSAVDIFSNSGEILLNSTTGEFSTTGTLDSTADTGSGTIQLAADGDITANDFNTSNNDGNAADITVFSQTGNIGTGVIDASSVDGEGGEVLLFSQEGAINAGDIDTSSENSIGGNVTLQGLENVTTASIDASGSGGEIDLRSTNGGIASSGTLTSGGEDVSLQGSGNVTVTDIFSNGGEILLNSTTGEITTTGTLDSTADTGSGTIQLAADGDITANNFNTSNTNGNAADITVFSQTGNIGTGEIDASSVSGDGGTVQLHAASGSTSSGNIDTSSNRNSGDVTLFGEDGVTTASIDASGSGGEIDLRSTNGSIASSRTLTSGGEDVTLQGSGNVTVADIFSNGGEILLNSTGGEITTTGTLDSTADTGSGTIQLAADGDITANNFNTSNTNGNAADITVFSQTGNIGTGEIDASSVSGDSGTVQLHAESGSTSSGNINTSSNSGNSGDVTLFGEDGVTTASIDASGSGGEIDLRSTHGGIASSGTLTSGGEDVSLQGSGNVTVADIFSNGGEILLNSTTGEITTTGTLDSTADRASGTIQLAANGNITANNFNTSSRNGNAADITVFSQTGNIGTGEIDASSVSGDGGTVQLHAASGSTSSGNIDTSSNRGNSGDVTLFGEDGVTTASIDASGSGGAIDLRSTHGGIDTRRGTLTSGGKDVTLRGLGNVAAAGIVSNRGEILLNSTAGTITIAGTLDSTADTGSGSIELAAQGNIIADRFNTSSNNGNAGDVTLYSATGNIGTRRVVNASAIDGDGGAVRFHAEFGSITAGNIDTSSENGNSGDVTLFARNNLTTASIDASGSGGEIDLRSTNGGIASRGTLTSGGDNITLHSRGNLTTRNITSGGGAIELRSSNGGINTTNGRIDSSGTGGNGGNVTLHSRGNLTTRNITSDGGNIRLTSTNSISSNGTIDSSGTGANGGNIDLRSHRRIDTQDVTSGGGNIKLKTSAQNSTIDTRGGTIDSRAAGQTGKTRTAASFRPNPGRTAEGTIRIGRVMSGSGNRVSLTVPSSKVRIGSDTVGGGNAPNPPSAPSQVVALTAPSIAGTTGTLNAPNIAGTTGTIDAPNIAGTAGIIDAPNIAGTAGTIAPNIASTAGTIDAPNIAGTAGTIAPPDITVTLPDIVPPPVALPPSIANADIAADDADNLDNATPSISDSGNATTPLNSLVTNSQSTSISTEATSTIETGSGTAPTVATPIATPITSIPTETRTETVAANPGSGTTSIAPIPTETVATPIETPIASTPTDVPVTATPTQVALLPEPSLTSTPTTPETNAPRTNADTSIVNSGANTLDLVSSANLEIRNSTPNDGRSLQTLARAAGNCLEAAGLLGSEAGTALEAVPTDYTEAIACYQTNLEFARASGDRPREQYTLYNLATSYYAIGNYAEALSYHQQGLEIATSEGNILEQAQAWKGVGDTYGAIGSFDRAIEAYESGLEIARSMDSVALEGELLRNLGQVYYARQDYETARELQQQSLVLAIQAGNRTAEANALNALGLTRYKLIDYDAAISLQQQSLNIARELGDRTLEGRALENLGLTYYAREEYDTAIDYHQQSLAIARQNNDRHGEARALNNLGDALDRAGKLEESEETLLAAIETWESLRKNLGDRDLDRVAIFETQETTYSTLQENLVSRDRIDRALEITERGRSRAFVDLLARRHGEQAQEFDRASEIQPPNIDEIRAIAREQNSTLVSYSVIQEVVESEGVRQLQDKELYIWVVQPTGDVAFRRSSLESVVAERGSLQKLVTNSRCFSVPCLRRKGVSRNISDRPLNPDLQQLYQLTIEPIADLLPQNPEERVTLIPHRSMFLIPFPALQDASGQYLIEQQTISTAPSIQVLALTHQQQQRNAQRNLGRNLGEALVVGNPTMPSVAFSAGATPYQLDPLPGAESEAIAIAQLLGTEALTGDAATEKAIVEGMSRSRIVHLATHGLLEDFQGLGLPGAIATAPSDRSDGLLASGEIFDLDLSAELVVLSACHTGQGRISEDGVVGLSRSFMAAGVPSLVVSLWAVPDDSTSDLMVDFYRQLATTPDKAQALRQAMLSTLEQYPSPENWAAFTLMGES